jgi:hypothetical protein
MMTDAHDKVKYSDWVLLDFFRGGIRRSPGFSLSADGQFSIRQPRVESAMKSIEKPPPGRSGTSSVWALTQLFLNSPLAEELDRVVTELEHLVSLSRAHGHHP